MRRIAFFVEGASEMLFVERLLNEVASAKNIVVNKVKIRGGGKSGKHPKQFREVGAIREATDEHFFAIIYDCGGDHLVGQRIKEEHKGLTDTGYDKIVGVRDVRPDFTREEVGRLKAGMEGVVDKTLAPVVFVLSTMEVEAWFLAEYSHFERIHPELTPGLICEKLGFDPRTFNPADRDNPASDLERSYLLKGVVYDKYAVEKTVDVLDFNHIYLEMSNAIPELRQLATTVDEFLTPAPADQRRADAC